MKRIFYALIAIIFVAFTSSCSKDDNNISLDDLGSIAYEGNMNITKDGTTTYSDPSAVVNNSFNKKGSTITIDLDGIKFDNKMPITLDITLNNIPYSIKDDIVTFSVSSVVPTVAGKQYEQYTFTNLQGKMSFDGMEYSANCMGYKIEFKGIN